MALTRAEKAVQLADLKERLSKATSTIFATFAGLTVAEASELRRRLRAGKAEMKVAKKTLMQIAAKDAGLPELQDSMLMGPVACIFSEEDPVSGAQIAAAYAKDHPQISFLGGLFDGKILSRDQAKVLAAIPSRQVLLSTFAGMIQSPLRSFMSICNSPLTGFARALSEVAKKKATA